MTENVIVGNGVEGASTLDEQFSDYVSDFEMLDKIASALESIASRIWTFRSFGFLATTLFAGLDIYPIFLKPLGQTAFWLSHTFRHVFCIPAPTTHWRRH